MNINERENLKMKIEADLRLLIKESWDSNVIQSLENVLTNLQNIYLEGYDD